MTNSSPSRPPQRARPAAPARQPAPSGLSDEAPVPTPMRPVERPGTPTSRPTRRLFWVGFVTSFLLLSAVSCGGLVLSTGLNRLDLASLQGGEAGWSPPLVTPTPTLEPNVGGATAGQGDGALALGEQVRNITNSRVNIRQTPGHLGKSDSDILAQMQPGATVTIIGGPTSADNLVWWQIQFTASDGRTLDGWAAEATGSGVQILGQ